MLTTAQGFYGNSIIFQWLNIFYIISNELAHCLEKFVPSTEKL